MAKKPKTASDDMDAPTGDVQAPPPADASISAAMHPTAPKVPSPTVGRIVHFVTPDRRPLAALVIGVGAGDEVTLSVFTPNGGRFTKTCGAAMNNDGSGWAWPPKV